MEAGLSHLEAAVLRQRHRSGCEMSRAFSMNDDGYSCKCCVPSAHSIGARPDIFGDPRFLGPTAFVP